MCIYIPHISHIVSQGSLQFYLSEIGRQLENVKERQRKHIVYIIKKLKILRTF